jgi:hypothetical protein
VFPDGSYQLTDDDVLWMARAAAFEGGDAADVLWTLTQRYSTARKHYPTFAEFVQAFSQPINPIWRRDGSKCRPGGPYHGRPQCSETRLQRRERAASVDWDTLLREHPASTEATLQWATAMLPNPVPTATNFAAPSVAAGYLDRHPEAKLVKQAGNWFIAEGYSKNWAPDRVRMRVTDGGEVAHVVIQERSRFRTALATFIDAVVHPIKVG